VKAMAKSRLGSRKAKTPGPAPKRLAPTREQEARVRAATLALGEPTTRPLKAYAFDPSQGRLLGNEMALPVRYESLDPGPVVRDPYSRAGVAIIDYDASNDCYYQPVDLDDPAILIRGGLDPSEAEPRFHQQMVYAVVTETIQHFEAALGRRLHWRRVPRDGRDPEKASEDNIYTLNIFPHAMVGANAFYCPKAHGILFGYFRANETGQGANLPGQIVYTCLSHDIVVHETTHAIIDGIRSHFTEQTNPDVCAFHEAFADLAALFRHFSHKDVLLETIQRTGGKLYEAEVNADAGPGRDGREGPVISAQLRGRNPLIDLARQFGEATGRGKGLRSALDTPPNSTDIKTQLEPHARGSILVAAVFDAYFRIYLRRTADLFRIYRAGGGNPGADIPVPLARMLADHASTTASMFFRVCVRALDYCPPVDITFGDFLRAVITSDLDVYPIDEYGVRDAFMQAFRLRGILPDGASYFSETAIAWPTAGPLPPIQDLEFGDPNGLTHEQQDAAGRTLRAYLDVREHREMLGFDPELPICVPSFHPMSRINEDGSVRTDMVVEVVQMRDAQFDAKQPGLGSFPFRGGATLIISKPPLGTIRRQEASGGYMRHGNIRYVIGKHLNGAVGDEREQRQRMHYERMGLVEGGDPDRFAINFALTHGGM
jgi:hypothetical protein